MVWLVLASTAWAEEGLERAPMYVSTRAGIAIPFQGRGDLPSAGVGMGLVLPDGSTLGLRAVYLHDVPPGTRAGDPPPDWAWGPMIDYQMHFMPEQSRGIYANLSAGFVYGTPEGRDNVVVPLAELGVGLRMSRELQSGHRLFISPEVGLIPTFFDPDGSLIQLEAPYAAVSVGWMPRG